MPSKMQIEPLLAKLQAEQLVRAINHGEYVFKHTLTQETVYESLLRSTRRAVHAHVAQTYEELYAHRLDEYAAVLAQHYAEAGDTAKMFAYAARAGDAAARLHAHAEAIVHYSRALQVGCQALVCADATLEELYLKRGRVLEHAGQYAQAIENYLELEKLGCDRANPRLELAGLMARATVYATPTHQQNLPLAHELADRALALAQSLNDAVAEAKILWTLLLAHYFQAEYTQAIQYGEQSLAIARRLNLREQIAFTLNDLGRIYFSVGRTDDAHESIAQARELWRAMDNLPMLADNLATSAEGAFFLGDYAEALRAAREGLELSRAIGNLWNQSYSLWTIGYTNLELGRIAEGIQALETAIALAQPAGFAIAIAVGNGMLAWAYGEMGQPQRALEFLNATQPDLDQIHPGLAEWHLALAANLHLLAGNLVPAQALIDAHIAAIQSADLTFFAPVFMGLAACKLAILQNAPARAIAIADQVLARMAQVKMRSFVADVLFYKGQAFYLQKEFDQAHAILDAARAEAQAHDNQRSAWTILHLLAQVETARGDVSQAQQLNAQAREIVADIAAHSPADLRASFLNLPAVREVLSA